MASHAAPRSRRALRAAVAALAAAALLAPAAARARQFSAGSLIIPASIEYQTDLGVLSTYSLVYIALLRNATATRKITFYWAVEPRKLSQYRCDTETSALPSYSPTYNDNDGCDFYVRHDAGQPVSLVAPDGTLTAPFDVSNVRYRPTFGPERVPANSNNPQPTHSIDGNTRVVKYLGGVWIVDATDREAFLALLQDDQLARFHRNGPTGEGGENYVNIHNANANFEAPIVSAVKDRPPRAAGVGGSAEFQLLANVLRDSGLCQPDTIPDCGGTFSASAATFTHGTVYDYYPNPGDLLDASTGCADGRLNCPIDATSTEHYGVFWASDSTGADMMNADRAASLRTFLQWSKGNVAFVQYDSISRIENAVATGTFQTSNGVQESQPNISSAEDCNDATLPNQAKFHSSGGECLVLGGANQPWAQTGNFVFDGGQGYFKAFNLNAAGAFDVGVTTVLRVRNASSGALGGTVSSGTNLDNDPEQGLALYLAGHRFDNNRFWGERLILNTLFNHLGDPPEEFARSEPVGYVDGEGADATSRVYQGTYEQLPPPTSNDLVTYNAAAAQIWKFPYIAGHLYEYDVSDLDTTAQAFGEVANANWDAGEMITRNTEKFMEVLPEDRTIYTYVNGSGNLGWKRIGFDHTQTGTSCWDGDSNAKCDLSELLALGVSAGVTSAALENRNVGGTQSLKLGLLVSQVRGHCAAHTTPITGTPIPAPSDDQCDNARQKNRAKLGGIDHSTPAVVGPSRYMTTGDYADRPVVIYAGARDGMLHAFFVSGTGGWDDEHGNALASGLDGGEELWAIIPPAQVPKLASNTAAVDGTINVVDVFGNFPYDRNNDGVIDWGAPGEGEEDERPDGVRRWRTVLIASAGEGDSELFALDVTSPIHPVLLWHVRGTVENDDRWDTDEDGVFEAGETFAPGTSTPDPDVPGSVGDPRTFALKWTDDEDVDYLTADTATILGMKKGRYNYEDLGKTFSSAVAKVWSGSGFQYMLFVATNAKEGSKGAEVFAIDVVTGQKQWQWEHLYDQDGYVPAAGVDNSVPPRMALGDIDANGSTERIYVGDLEGHVWELYSRDGRNVNFLEGDDDELHSFPLFGTAKMTGTEGATDADAHTIALYEVNGSSAPSGLSQQPLTTPIGQGRFTRVPDGLGVLLGRLSLVVGTMGVDWAIAPFEKGHIFVIPVHPDQDTRLTPPIDMDAPRDPMMFGVLLEDAAWDIDLAVGERVFGMPRVINNEILFNTAFGSFSGDISATATDPGNLWQVGITTTGEVTEHSVSNNAKSFGGVVVVGNDVVVTTDSGIKKMGEERPDVAGGGVGTSTFNRATPAILKSWEVVP